MTDHPTARIHRPAGTWTGSAERLVLDYDSRLLRRRMLRRGGGAGLLVDLAETTALAAGDALETTDGQLFEIGAAPEALVAVTAPPGALIRIAWHVGNRHTPCQIAPDRLLIRRDHVIEAMLVRLGATLTPIDAPFTPEGGAYGLGRTMAHSHGPAGGHGAADSGTGGETDAETDGEGRADGETDGRSPAGRHRDAHGHGHEQAHSHSHGPGHHPDAGHAPAPPVPGSRRA